MVGTTVMFARIHERWLACVCAVEKCCPRDCRLAGDTSASSRAPGKCWHRVSVWVIFRALVDCTEHRSRHPRTADGSRRKVGGGGRKEGREKGERKRKPSTTQIHISSHRTGAYHTSTEKPPEIRRKASQHLYQNTVLPWLSLETSPLILSHRRRHREGYWLGLVVYTT